MTGTSQAVGLHWSRVTRRSRWGDGDGADGDGYVVDADGRRDGFDGVTLSVNPASVGEADGATAVVVTAALDGGARGLGDGGDGRGGGRGDSATEGTDYATVSDFTVTIGAGATSGTGTFTLTPTQDLLGEGDETISVGGTATGLTVTGDVVDADGRRDGFDGGDAVGEPGERGRGGRCDGGGGDGGAGRGRPGLGDGGDGRGGGRRGTVRRRGRTTPRCRTSR